MTLSALRFDQGLSPEQLAERVGVSGHTIRRIEAGHKPSASTAKKIADYFDLKPTDLWPAERAAA